MLQFQTHLCEWRLLQLEDFARATGQLTGLLIVQDMFAPNGLLNAWRKHGSKSKIMRRLTSMMDEHYPGVMESVLLVNAPWAMHAILRILTPLLPQRVGRAANEESRLSPGVRILSSISAGAWDGRLPKSVRPPVALGQHWPALRLYAMCL